MTDTPPHWFINCEQYFVNNRNVYKILFTKKWKNLTIPRGRTTATNAVLPGWLYCFS
jgi:hypothetical protein